jgi:hypothetical protein
LVTLALVLLGAAWPSLYTIIAIPVIPAVLVFAVALFRPVAVWGRPKIRLYLNLCVAASGLAWLFQIFWVLHE